MIAQKHVSGNLREDEREDDHFSPHKLLIAVHLCFVAADITSTPQRQDTISMYCVFKKKQD